MNEYKIPSMLLRDWRLDTAFEQRWMIITLSLYGPLSMDRAYVYIRGQMSYAK